MLVATPGNTSQNYYDKQGGDEVIEQTIDNDFPYTEENNDYVEKIIQEDLLEIPEEESESTDNNQIIGQDNQTDKKEEKLDYKAILKQMKYYKNDYSNENINMRNAILRFQSRNNLRVDGSFGQLSEKALKKAIKDKNYQYNDVITNFPTNKEWISINKTKRILTLYKGEEVIKKYPIAQGKTKELTPEGKFTIVNKYINPRWGGAGISSPIAGGSPNNPLGYRWMGISYGGGGSYGIHGNNKPNSIGTDVSMGCIRMINSDVEELFQLISLQTPVWIGTHEKLQEWGVHNRSYTF